MMKPHIPIFACGLALSIMLALTACADGHASSVAAGTVHRDSLVVPVRQGQPGVMRRTFGDTSMKLWSTDWIRDGNDATSGIMYPTALVASRSAVYVLDGGARRVLAFDATTGARRWMYPDSASTERLGSAMDLALDRDGGVVVVQQNPGQLLTIDAQGKRIRSAILPANVTPAHVCVRHDGLYLLGMTGADRPLMLVGAGGEALPTGANGLPWPALSSGARIIRQFRLAGNAGSGACVLAATLGLGFADANQLSPESTRPYVETVQLPRVRITSDSTRGRFERSERILERRLAVVDAQLDGDTLVVAFEGVSGLRGRLIDLYAWPSGAYQRSLLFPAKVEALARVGGRYFAITQRQGAPAVVALRHE